MLCGYYVAWYGICVYLYTFYWKLLFINVDIVELNRYINFPFKGKKEDNDREKKESKSS